MIDNSLLHLNALSSKAGVYNVDVRPYYISSLSKGSSEASEVLSCIFSELTIFSFSCLCSLLSLSFSCSLDCKIEKEKVSFQGKYNTVRVLASRMLQVSIKLFTVAIIS